MVWKKHSGGLALCATPALATQGSLVRTQHRPLRETAAQRSFSDGVKLSARDKSAKSQVEGHIRSTYPVNDRIGGLSHGKNGGFAAPTAEASPPCGGARHDRHRATSTAP